MTEYEFEPDTPVPVAPRTRGVGPIVLIVPALLFALAVLVLRDHAPDPGPRPAPPMAEGEGNVPGWSGIIEASYEEGGGALVTANLSPLHPDPRRQAFDARALQKQLGLGPGEPWLLTLRYEARDRARDQDGGLPAGEPEDSEGLSVQYVTVRDSVGEALTTLDPESSRSLDPLRTLLAPTPERVEPGESVHVFLWGREPVDEVTLHGVLGTPDVPMALQAKDVERHGDTLAKLERDRADPLNSEQGR